MRSVCLQILLDLIVQEIIDYVVSKIRNHEIKKDQKCYRTTRGILLTDIYASIYRELSRVSMN